MSTVRDRRLCAETDYRGLEVTNQLLNPIESLVLDLALAACVQADFENAPEDTPFYIELDDDILGAGALPHQAITEARAQLITWELNAREDSRNG